MYDFKQFNSCFAALSMHVSKHEAFSLFLDFCLMVFDPINRHRALSEYSDNKRIANKNTPQLLLEMFSIIGDLSDNGGEGFGDPLGEFFTIEITNGHNGQFFTPEPICDMMAMFQGESQPGQSVLDPACGSGRTLLSKAKRNRFLRFFGADVDHICVKMTVLNFLFNSLSGEVAHMNTLSNDFFCGYKTFTVLGSDGMRYPYFTKFTDPNESYIWLRPPAAQPSSEVPEFKPAPPAGQQGSLF
jgi:hypothetical protein